MKRFSTIIIAILLLLPLSAEAQSVGVVMSGGGAKGLYHIGVLRALEENGIPIDYIAGTSMGSIIGGMYAAGYTIEEMEEVALSGDLDRWVSGGIDDKYRYHYIQRDRISNMITLPVGPDSKDAASGRQRIILPGSVISSAEIDIALNSFFAQASTAAGGNFDNLMIPFRCMATDMSEHRAVELSSGDLALAIRASMALPVAFPPVEIDSVLMCDGGCYDNFPWRSLEDNFHPDVLIGACCVDIKPKSLKDASVVDQLMSLITKPTDFNMPADRSVLVQRAVEASTLDFKRAAEIMAAGYNDALEAMPEIKAKVSRRMSKEDYAERRRAFIATLPRAHMGNVEILGLKESQARIAHDMMYVGHNKAKDTLPLSGDEITNNFLTMLANVPVKSAFPIFRYNDATERYDVTLPLSVKPNFDISIGGNISSTAFNQAYLGLEYGWWSRVGQTFNLDILLGPVYTMARLKGRTTLIYDAPIYFDYSYNFNIHNTLKGNFGNLTQVDNAEQMRVMENFGSLSVGMALSRKAVADITINGGRNSYSYEMVGYPKRQYTHFSYLSGGVSLERTSLNKPLFPTSGTHLMATGIYVYGRDERDSRADIINPEPEDRFSRIRQWWGIKAKWEQYFDVTSSGIFSWGYAVEGVYTNHPTFDSREATLLSSPHYAPLLHSRMIYMPEFRANRYLGVGLMPTLRIIDNLYARLSVYAMLRDKFAGEIVHYMSDLSIIYHTPIGPVSLALTKYDFSSSKNLYLTFNFGYAIFGRKGLFF
ncbi:MAG: patatin-like phospholipase family protein [Alistipes sp.]|nr:patatin-like phospholipase family protein [Alistipes sp.]